MTTWPTGETVTEFRVFRTPMHVRVRQVGVGEQFGIRFVDGFVADQFACREQVEEFLATDRGRYGVLVRREVHTLEHGWQLVGPWEPAGDGGAT